MASQNKYPGLARGPIDHASSSVINLISETAIAMGDVVLLETTLATTDIIPRVKPLAGAVGDRLAYGIAVGGDADGIYGDGSAANALLPQFQAATEKGQGVVILTQGRGLARVTGAVGGAVIVGDRLVMSTTLGVLRKVSAPGTTATIQQVVAMALNSVLAGDTNMIAVDWQREGGNSIT